jgi:alkylation response protein AidB-like acyl-CoA dehydrogenase
MLGPAGRIAGMRDRFRDWAVAAGVLDEPEVARALTQAEAVLRVNELLNWQVACAETVNVADASVTKVFSSEQAMRIGGLLYDLAGKYGDPAAAELMEWLDVQIKRNTVLTFGGGVNEVQRELIASFGLGLARAPR